MQAPFDNIVQHLFHQPSLQSVTVDELERMAQQHPYFAAAHFLLLKKMQDTDHPQFGNQLHKTTLYFNNPLWLQYLLQPETVSNFTVSETAPFITNEADVPASLEEQQPVFSNGHAGNNSFVSTEQLPVTEEWHEQPNPPDETTEQHYQEEAPAVSTAPVSIMDVITEVFEEENKPDVQTASLQPQQEETAINIESSETINESYPANTYTEEVQTPSAEIFTESHEADYAQHDAQPETVKALVEITQQDEIHNEEPSPTVTEEHVEPAEISVPEVEYAAENNESPGNPENTIAVAEELPVHVVEVSQPVEDENPADATQPDEHQPAAFENAPQLLKTIIETPGAKDDLLFEPYHTVDYFASQGIKLSKLEAEPKDKLGRQLKSFTEWLKSMKRLPQVSIDKILSENEESKVVADAIHSIENKEVNTEAMAEVFEKQGLTEKAVEVYEKLSLLNPGKSAYFAAKIDLLKK